MSFTDFKEITPNSPGTSLRYGGDDLKQVMQILNGKTVANKRPKIVNEWIWQDHFDIQPPAVVPTNPTDTNASRFYADPTDFRIKIKKTGGAIIDIENTNIPDSALATITNRAKLPTPIAYEDEANIFTATQKVTKAAEPSIAELVQEWSVADDALSKFDLINASGSDATFVPMVRGFFRGASTAHPGLYIFSHIPSNQDGGTMAAFVFDARKHDNAAITVRPLFRFRSAGTSVFEITPTSIDFTNKTIINPGNVLLTTLDNNLGDHYVDFGDIAAPANPAAGVRRVFLNSATGELSVRTSAGATISLESIGSAALDALTDVVVPTPTLNDVLTFNGTNWVNAVPPGATGGEANLGSNIGSGGVGIFKQKTGVTFEFKKINAGSNKVTITDDTGNDEVDIDVAQANLSLESIGGSITTRSKIPATVVYDDEANTYGDFDQIFRSSRLILRNSSNTFSYLLAGADIAANRTVTFPLLIDNDTLITENHIQPLTGKTIDAANNTISNIANAQIATHTSTKITITNLAQLSTALLNNTQDNNFGAHFFDVSKIVIPVAPAANHARFYVKEIDANNDGVFVQIKKNGAFREVQVPV